MIKILKATQDEGYKIVLEFSDGSKAVADLSYLLDFGTSLSKPLKDKTFFDQFFIEAGTLCWKHGLELSGSSLHLKFIQTDCHAA
ncbi:DUF2442 domain-containing protein [Sulfuricurvum sp.]|uniref:DUF2442 domain-containing protein n=1 Tax=Sulfuricurvum sp. TaxID=2025608 RepID=UPI0019932CA7|nr:DUF2442 domain-containing protein [Sulfuricurvum sp.]MBD3799320.1 DUF2442 domain-containing protein [Campylobacterota bacterium]MBD3806804.1 DUF2442 domain-containing protein [Sulfuricurvum sp.]